MLRLQSAARNSTEWFEDVERYLHLDPVQFNYSLLTRSQRISHENLRLRDKAWLESAEMWFEEQATSEKPTASRPPMFTPFRLRDLDLKNRIVRVADGAISRRRRHADRLALRALRRARQGRGRAGHHRDDLRVGARGASRPAAPASTRRARGRLEAHRRLHPRRDRRQDRHPARTFRAQRLDPARLGGRGRAAAGGQLAGHRPVAGARGRRTTRCRAR